MLASLAIYVSVVEVIRTNRAPFPGFAGYDPTVLRYVFFAIGLAMFVMARVGWSRMLAASTMRDAPPASSAVARRLQAATIVSLANCEAIAVLGFVLFLLGGQSTGFLRTPRALRAGLGLELPALEPVGGGDAPAAVGEVTSAGPA